MTALLESVEDDTADRDAGALDDAAPSEDAGQAVPRLDDLTALGDPCLRW